METMTTTEPDLDMLFDLFNEDFCDDDEVFDWQRGEGDSDNTDDNTDETSSESSGSSGRSGHSSPTSSSPPFRHISNSAYYPSPSSVVFASNQSSFTNCPGSTSCSSGESSCNKRTKIEDKLMRNRESANKSRLKRKNEKFELEDTVAALREQVRTLEMENNALLTDNTTLSQHNFFLQSMLKKQQESGDRLKDTTVSPKSHMSALSGISMLCVVFSISFFNDWLPSSLQSSGQESWHRVESSSGRVLLSVSDDDLMGRARHFSLADSSFTPGPPRGAEALHYVLILASMFLYYFYIQRSRSADKSARLLPS